MAYIDQQGMVERFGEDEIKRLTDRQRTGSIDAEVLAAAIQDAQSEVDAYTSSRYTVPLAVVTDAVKRTTADIARYRLYDEKCPDTVRNRYQEAIAFLNAVAGGRATLGNGPSGESAGGSAAIETVRTSADRKFSLDKLQGY
jgi:phage gp36-like protein